MSNTTGAKNKNPDKSMCSSSETSSCSSSDSESSSSCEDSQTKKLIKKITKLLVKKLKGHNHVNTHKHDHKQEHKHDSDSTSLSKKSLSKNKKRSKRRGAKKSKGKEHHFGKKNTKKESSESSETSETDSSDSDCEPDSVSEQSDDDNCGKGMIDYGDGYCVPSPTMSPRNSKSKNAQCDKAFFSTDRIIMINRKNKHILEDDVPKVVLFYAPWCEESKKIKDEYIKVANDCGPLYAVNADEEENLVNKFYIKGYPTIVMIVNNEIVSTFHNKNVYKNIKSWVVSHKHDKSKQKSTSKSKSVRSKQKSFSGVNIIENEFKFKSKYIKMLTHDSLHHASKPMVVLFYAPWCGHCKKFKPEYDQIADDLKMTLYAVNCDEESELANKFHIQGFPTIKCIKSDNEHISFGEGEHDGHRNREDVSKWIKTHMHGVKDENTENGKEVIEITDGSSEILNGNGVIAMFYADWCGHCKTTKPIFHKVASALHKKIPFVMINGDKNALLKQEFSINGYPSIFYLKRRIAKDEFIDAREEASFQKWVEKWIK